MTAIFYFTIVLLWLLVGSITRHLLTATYVHASENDICPTMHRKMRQVIVVTSLVFGTMAHYGMSHVYTLHQLTIGG